MLSRSIQKFISCTCFIVTGIVSTGICKQCPWIMCKHPDTPVYFSKEISRIESSEIYGASARSAIASTNTVGTIYFDGS